MACHAFTFVFPRLSLITPFRREDREFILIVCQKVIGLASQLLNGYLGRELCPGAGI